MSTIDEVKAKVEKLAVNKKSVPAEIINLQEKKFALSGEEAALAHFKNYCVVADGGKTNVCWKTIDPELGTTIIKQLSPTAFKELHAHETVSTSKGKMQVAPLWLKATNRPTYLQGFAMLPGKNSPKDVYNLWTGFGCEVDSSSTPMQARKALWHLKYVICGGDQTSYRYSLGWLAHAFQNPKKQAEVAFVMLGGRGAGKGTLGGWFIGLFGSHGTHIQNSEHLTGRFNSHLKSTVALFVDEAFFVGDRAAHNVLKGLITENRIMVEPKNVNAYPAKNRLKIIMATNEAHAIPAGTDERRYFITHVSDRVKQNHKYFAELNEWWQDGGDRAFFTLLKRIALSEFNIRKVPETAALGQQKIESLKGIDAWLYELLQDSDRWKPKWSAQGAANDFRSYCEQKGGQYKYEGTSATAVGKGLRKWLVVERRRASTTHSRNWELLLPELNEARAQFAKTLNVRIDWDV
jgi:hypothetical protein